jgi:short-subunit dehydrogenase
MAVEFAKKGADIILVSRSEEKLKLAISKVEVYTQSIFLTLGLAVHLLSKSLHFTALI